MATQVGTENDTTEMLEHLIALDYDAAEAYQAAIDRLDGKDFQVRLAEFKADHERHIRELTPVVQQMGGTAPTGPDSTKGLMAQGKVAMANIMGDKAILEAMKTNENDTNTAYERVLDRAPPEALEIVTRGREDERRHCEWILATLETM